MAILLFLQLGAGVESIQIEPSTILFKIVHKKYVECNLYANVCEFIVHHVTLLK